MNSAFEVVLKPDLAVEFDSEGGLASLLKRQATTQPQHAAVIFQGVTYSYDEVSHRTSAIAAELIACGIRHGERVGLLFPNHPNYVAAFFGITAVGATVVPINPLLKFEEIQHVLEDSNARALIVQESCWNEVARTTSALNHLANIFILTDALTSKFDSERDGIEITTISSDELSERGRTKQVSWSENIEINSDLAVLVYTSGTTGKPKGAMLTHKNLLAAVEMAHAVCAITASDRFIVMIPMCHIYGMAVVMLGLIAKGATLVILDKFDPVGALKTIEELKVTGMPAVPAMYQFMLMEMENNTYDLSSLRVCLSGAAPMPIELFRRLSGKFPVPILEGYGLTETASIVSLNPIDGKIKEGSVGIPVPKMNVSIRDQEGKVLPNGAEFIGEVTVKAPNIMQGYFGKPEATAECLVDGWFTTGDLGYVDEEGYLYIAGRSKELILRGGQNIYPREVEDVIMRMPGVAEVAVIGVPDKYMGERVKAVVVRRNNQPIHSEDEIKQFCAELLAEYKVPRLVEFIDALPRNSTGKVIKRALQSS